MLIRLTNITFGGTFHASPVIIRRLCHVLQDLQTIILIRNNAHISSLLSVITFVLVIDRFYHVRIIPLLGSHVE
jgi:hypothetical protein